jgi:hypothetical protein
MFVKAPRRSCILAILGFGALAFLFGLLVPSSPRSDSELYGDYVLDCDLVHEHLSLRPDGSYVQTVTIKATSQIAVSEGRWTYDKCDRHVHFVSHFLLSLSSPFDVNPSYASPSQGLVAYTATRWMGRVTLRGWVDDWPGWRKLGGSKVREEMGKGRRGGRNKEVEE